MITKRAQLFFWSTSSPARYTGSPGKSVVKNTASALLQSRLRSFSGIIGCYRRFLGEAAVKLSPLTDLLKGSEQQKSSKKNIRWEEQEDIQNYTETMAALKSTEILGHNDRSLPLTLLSDASGTYADAVLEQEQIVDDDTNKAPLATFKK